MQNTVSNIVANWFADLPVAPAPVVVSDPYADCERMTLDEGSQLINRKPWVAGLTRKFDANTHPVQVQRHTRAEYHFAGHRHDPSVKTSWKNVDAGKAADAKKGKK